MQGVGKERGARRLEVACYLAGGLELTVLEDLGVGRLGDNVTVFVFAWVLLSSGMLMNTGILNLPHHRLFVKTLQDMLCQYQNQD